MPSIIPRDMGARVSLDSLARSCVSKGGGYVRAQQLDRPVKLFTRWDNNNYLKGEPGDWLVAQSGEDLYIVTKELFPRLYNA